MSAEHLVPAVVTIVSQRLSGGTGSPAAGQLTDVVFGRLRATRVGRRIVDDLVQVPTDPARQYGLGEALYDLVGQDPQLAEELAGLVGAAGVEAAPPRYGAPYPGQPGFGPGDGPPAFPHQPSGPPISQPPISQPPISQPPISQPPGYGPPGYGDQGSFGGPAPVPPVFGGYGPPVAGGYDPANQPVPPPAPKKKSRRTIILAVGLPLLLVGLICFGVFGLPIIAALVAGTDDIKPVSIAGTWYDDQHQTTYTITADGQMTIRTAAATGVCTGHLTKTSDSDAYTGIIDTGACKPPLPVGQPLEVYFHADDTGGFLAQDRSAASEVRRVGGGSPS